MSVFLETKRLILKAPELSHLEDLTALRTDPDVMRYIGAGEVQTKEQVKEFLELSGPYLKKYGMAFFSVFEKLTGDFVGQAGLLHLCLDADQPDIELAYRLHKKYWHLGYATELSKALIDWGFNALSLSKIVAIVHPENERSRWVIEKSGMSYRGMINYDDGQVPCYEINKNQLNFSLIELIPATLEEYPIIQNMGRFYVYDMSEYMGRDEGWEMPVDGLYECLDFKKYWQTNEAFPFLIRYQDELVGFVIIDKKGSDVSIDFNVAQFFISRKFKGKGVGRYVAHQCFDRFKGTWEVMVIPGNEGAYRFWRSTIKKYSRADFVEYTRQIAHFNNSKKNIFKFNSRSV